MFADEILARFVALGVGTLGTQEGTARSMYHGSTAVIPTGELAVGPYLSLVETGGTGSVRTQQDTAVERPTAQVSVRGEDRLAIMTMLQAAYMALGGANGLHNLDLSGVRYLSIVARQQCIDIGPDASGRPMVAFNFDAEKEPS